MRKYRIVHIEDQAEIRWVVERSLEHLDVELFSIDTAEDGMSYLASDAEIDLILCDFNFSGEQIDGLDLARRAKLLRPTTPFILISGGSGRLDKESRFEELLKFPGVTFLEKGSFGPKELETTVECFLPKIGHVA